MSSFTLVSNKVNTLHGEIEVPGDKSISHRAVILSMLSEGQTVIENYLSSEDIFRTIEVSRILGADIYLKNEIMEVYGKGLEKLVDPKKILNFGNSGTSIRLFMGILAAQKFDSVLTGDRSLRKRPMERVAKPLRAMGANLETNNGNPPVKIKGTNKLNNLRYKLDIPSAQIKSAILLASLFTNGKTVIETDTDTRDHTEIMLKDFSSAIEVDEKTISIVGGELVSPEYIYVPGDLSSASFLILAGLISKDSELKIKNVGLNPTRMGFIEIMKLMNADIEINTDKTFNTNEKIGSIVVRSSNLKGIDVPKKLIASAIDEMPLVFIAAACAEGYTSIKNAKELRYKESDRIKAMVNNLTSLSIEVNEYDDGARIKGGTIRGTNLDSFDDHRVAMACLLASCRSETPVTVKNCLNINTSFPTFKEIMNSIGMNIHEA